MCILRWTFSLAGDLGPLWLAVVCVCVCCCVVPRGNILHAFPLWILQRVHTVISGSVSCGRIFLFTGFCYRVSPSACLCVSVDICSCLHKTCLYDMYIFVLAPFCVSAYAHCYVVCMCAVSLCVCVCIYAVCVSISGKVVPLNLCVGVIPLESLSNRNGKLFISITLQDTHTHTHI